MRDDTMEEKKEEKTGRRPNPILTGFNVSGFPFKQFLEWKQDCESNYANNYWVKIWSDHLKAKNADLQEQVMAQDAVYDELKKIQSEEPKKKEEDEDKVQCLDGKY